MKLKKTITLVLMLSILFPFSTFAANTENEIYCKTTILHANEIEDIMIESRSENTCPELNLVKAVQKEVYLSETYDSTGKLLDSHFMTNKEVENLEKGIAPAANLGDETEVAGKLTFTATLYDDADNNYYAYATADWENGTWITTDGYDFPAEGMDYITIAWGGNNAFQNVDYRSSGTYQYIGDDIVFHESPNSLYKGICWNFDDVKLENGINYFADVINTSVKISPVNSTSQGKTSNVQFMYLHTYDDGNLSINFNTVNEKVYTTYSGMSAVRTIAIDFPELQY